MNYFLLCVEKPKEPHNEREWNFWQIVSSHIERCTKAAPEVQRLVENVWLIPVINGVEVLSDCIQICRSQGQKFRVAMIDVEPEAIQEQSQHTS